MPVKESVIEAHLVRRAKGAGCEVRKLAWINRRGAPDRIIIAPYDVWFVELKRPGGKPDPHQAREISRFRKLGAVVLVLDTIEKIDAWFDAYNQKAAKSPHPYAPYGDRVVVPRGQLIDKLI